MTTSRNSEHGNQHSATGRELLTRSGVMLPLDDARPTDIRLGDIAWGLAGVQRFAAQHPWRITVAQHSVAVAWLVSEWGPSVQTKALLHDAPEAYLGDLTSATKMLLRHSEGREMSAFDRYEDKLLRAICVAFGFDAHIPDRVKQADALACQFEMSLGGWHDTDPAPALDIVPDLVSAYITKDGGYSYFTAAAAMLGMDTTSRPSADRRQV
jgi:hypothetical protein